MIENAYAGYVDTEQAVRLVETGRDSVLNALHTNQPPPPAGIPWIQISIGVVTLLTAIVGLFKALKKKK